MSDATDTPSPEQPSEQQQPPQRSAPVDWRLIAIVAVAVAFLLAVFINKKFYDKKISVTPTTTLPAGATQPGEAAPALSMTDQYAAMIHGRELDARGGLYQFGDRVILLADPPRAITDEKDPRKLLDMLPGRLVDVTRCAEGVRPEMIFRRSIFGADRPVFMDYFPPLGLDPEPKMVFKAAAEATIDVIADQQRVIGVIVGGEARAYPAKMMNYHEVINDTVGGVPIVVTWSALAQSATAWERTLPDKSAAAFGSAGLIYQSAIVMYDKETYSLWWSTRGQALTGARVGGPALKPVQAASVSWKAWREFAPQTSVLIGTEPVLPIDYEVSPAVPQGYFSDSSVLYPVYGFDIEKNRIFPKAYVFVVIGPDGKSARTYVAQLLAQKATGPIEDAIGGAKVILKLDKESGILQAQMESGEPLIVRGMYWIACAGSYPEAELWDRETIMRDAEEAAGNQAPVTGGQ